MRNENPAVGILGLGVALFWVIYQGLVIAITFIINNLWILMLSAIIGLFIFLTLKYAKGRKLNKRQLWGYFAAHRLQLIFLMFAGTSTIILRKDNMIMALVIAGLVISYLILRFISSRFLKCKACNGAGLLSGHNAYLGIKFENDPCYVCSGTGKVLWKKSEWYHIAKKANVERKKLEAKRSILLNKRKAYSSQVRISENVNLERLKSKDERKKDQFTEYEKLIDSKIDHYATIEKQAHIAMHNYYIYHQQEKWDKYLEQWGDKNIDGYQNVLALSDEAELTQRYSIEISSFESLLESDVNAEIAKELRLDIEKATEKLKALFAKSA